MTEPHEQFNARRASEEKALTDLATDRLQSIPHGQLAKLHADEADASEATIRPQETALDSTAGSRAAGSRTRGTP